MRYDHGHPRSVANIMRGIRIAKQYIASNGRLPRGLGWRAMALKIQKEDPGYVPGLVRRLLEFWT